MTTVTDKEFEHEMDVIRARVRTLWSHCPGHASHQWNLDTRECTHCKAPYPWPEAPR